MRRAPARPGHHRYELWDLWKPIQDAAELCRRSVTSQQVRIGPPGTDVKVALTATEGSLHAWGEQVHDDDEVDDAAGDGGAKGLPIAHGEAQDVI